MAEGEEAAANGGTEVTHQVLTKLEDLVGEVEVNFKGQIEITSFPLKADIKFLREGTKDAFMLTVDLSSCEARMKEAIQMVWVGCGDRTKSNV